MKATVPNERGFQHALLLHCLLNKHVRKPRKSAPGAVTYQNEKTLFVEGIYGEGS